MKEDSERIHRKCIDIESCSDIPYIYIAVYCIFVVEGTEKDEAEEMKRSKKNKKKKIHYIYMI